MKFTKTLFAASLALCLSAAIFTGCAAAKRALYTPTPAPPATNSIPVLGITTNPVTGVVAVDVIGYSNIVSTPTNYVPAPRVQAILTTGQAVSTVLPPPWNAVALSALGGLSTILTLWGRKLSKQTTTQQAVIGSIITGVEAATDASNSVVTANSVKTAIQTAALANGVAGQVHAQVKQITEGAPPQI